MDSDYRLFAKIIECGGLSAAGRQLFMSPAVISKRLARLEDRLGVRLVHRTTRRLALTEPGERFYEDVVAILVAIEQAESRVAVGKKTPAGPLKVSAPSSFARLHVAPYLPEFLDKYPEVELELILSNSFVDLLSEKIDVAIRITPYLNPGLNAYRLASNARILCAAPSYIRELPANGRTAPPRDGCKSLSARRPALCSWVSRRARSAKWPPSGQAFWRRLALSLRRA